MSRQARAWLLAMVVIAGEASAQRISVSEFSGRGGDRVRAQVAAALCGPDECVPAGRVMTGGKLDRRLAVDAGVQAFIAGRVGKRGRRSVLDLEVIVPKGGASSRRTLALGRGGLLSAASLEAVRALAKAPTVKEVVGRSTEGGDPPPDARPVDARPVDARPVARDGAPEAVLDLRAASPPVEATKPKAVFFAVELGSYVLNRQLDYTNVALSGADVAPLRSYSLAVFSLPMVRFEVYPLAASKSEALAGLGAEGSFALNPILSSSTSTGAERFPTMAMVAEAALRWRLEASPSYPLVITPLLGFRIQSFTVTTPATESLKLMPDFAYVSLRAGLGLDVPIVKDGLLVLIGRISALPVFSSGEIISSTYFKNGSTLGFEGGVGLRLRIISGLFVAAGFEFAQYQLTFTPRAGDRYLAAAAGLAVTATDRYLGGSLTLRLEL